MFIRCAGHGWIQPHCRPPIAAPAGRRAYPDPRPGGRRPRAPCSSSGADRCTSALRAVRQAACSLRACTLAVARPPVRQGAGGRHMPMPTWRSESGRRPSAAWRRARCNATALRAHPGQAPATAQNPQPHCWHSAASSPVPPPARSVPRAEANQRMCWLQSRPREQLSGRQPVGRRPDCALPRRSVPGSSPNGAGGARATSAPAVSLRTRCRWAATSCVVVLHCNRLLRPAHAAG